MKGIHHKNQQYTGDGADVRTEERDDIGHTDDHTDQSTIRGLQYRGTDITEQTDDDGIYDLTA